MGARSGALLGGLGAVLAVFLLSVLGGAGPIARACAPLTGWRSIQEISPAQAAALRGVRGVAWLRATDRAPAAGAIARYAIVVVADADRAAAFALAAELAQRGARDVRVAHLPGPASGAEDERLQRFDGSGIESPRP
jgi:hypothetical protein